uniref:Uncharacterized protein n=1 Tax=Caenorhabditis tropicalis TaxID=1561998 RepID=A0A1I7SY24_9PELO
MRYRACAPKNTIFASQLGNINPIPFRQTGTKSKLFATDDTRRSPSTLGSTDPHPTTVHVEPFSTSVFKDRT